MRTFVSIAMLIAASFLISCTPAANNGNTNKPGNSANAANSTGANTSAGTATVDADIKKAVSDMAAALQKGDAAHFEKLYTDNYMFVGPDGSTSTGPERIASMKSGKTKYDSISYSDVTVRTNAEGNGAVSISKATVKGVNLGIPVDGEYRVTHVWSKTKDGWRLASGQTTAITASAGNSNAAPPANSNANTNS